MSVVRQTVQLSVERVLYLEPGGPNRIVCPESSLGQRFTTVPIFITASLSAVDSREAWTVNNYGWFIWGCKIARSILGPSGSEVENGVGSFMGTRELSRLVDIYGHTVLWSV